MRFFCVIIASALLTMPALKTRAQTPALVWEHCNADGSVRASAKISDSTFATVGLQYSCNLPVAFNLRCYTRTGKPLWTKSFSDPDFDLYAFSVNATSDGGFIISGYEDQYGTTEYNLIIKTNSNGDTLWTKKFFFGNIGTPVSGKVIATGDGGYCFAGVCFTSNLWDVQVIKLDANGNIQWNKTYGGLDDDYARDVIEVSDGFLVAASSASTDGDVTGNHGGEDVWILKLDGSGNLQWQKCYGGTKYDEAKSIVQVSPHRFIVAANSTSNNNDVSGHHGSSAFYDYWLFSINENGNLLWNKSLGGSNYDNVGQLAALSADEFAAVGSSYSSDGDVHNHHGTNTFDDVWVAAIDSMGTVLYDNSFGGSNYDHGNAIAVFDSAEFVAVGSSLSNDGDHVANCSDSSCYAISEEWLTLLNSKCVSVAQSSYTYTTNGQTIQFNNTSLNATSYAWNFGDGGSDSTANPVHTYAVNQNLSVCLTASNNCSGTQSCQTIATCKPLQPAFGISYSGLTATFNDNTPLAAAWNWNFGDGNFSSLENPVHTYSQNGNYTVTLTAFDSCGAGYTKTKTASTCNGIVAGFTFTLNGNTVNFSDNSIGSPDEWAWDFGDGNSSSSQNPAHTFTDGSTFHVCLTAGSNSCAATSTSCTDVNTCTTSAVAAFNTSSHDYQITFHNNSVNATTYHWDFGDGTSSTEVSPQHTYAPLTAIYTSCLIASDYCGADTTYKTIYMGLGPVTANFLFVALGLSVSFTNLSTNAVTYHWDFGDGTTSTATNPFHTYSTNSLYNVCLIAYDQLSNADTLCQFVSLCNDVDADFNYSASGLDVSFTDESPVTVQWLWDFGDGTVSSFENPEHTYTNNGTYTVCDIATNICGQSDTMCKTLTACGPLVGNFGYSQSFLTVTFSDSTNGASSWLWSFGDGNTSTAQNPVHNYPSSGDYDVCLVTVDVCNQSSVFCKTITVCNPVVANYSYTNSFLSASFTDLTPSSDQWNWNFGDGNFSSLQNPTHVYIANGTYNVCLIAKDNCGYIDTVCKSITVCAPLSASFGHQDDYLSVSFNDSTANATQWIWYFGDGAVSTQQNPVHAYASAGTYEVCMVAADLCNQSSQSCMSITVCDTFSTAFTASSFYLTTFFTAQTPTASQWNWDFGDGNSSSQENPLHTYSANGIYHACLTATDVCGRSDTMCHDVTVCAPLVANYSYTDSFLTVTFSSLTVTATGWHWNFGDGDTSSLEFPVHTYGANGTYQICLTITDLCGQTDSVCKTITVCAPLVLNFAWVQDNLTVTFTDESPNTVQWFWDFGDGGISTDENPVHDFPSLGVYHVCLIAFNICGSDTFCEDVNVQCPPFNAGFTFSVDAAEVQFTDQSANSVSWQWDFGDGGNSLQENPLHTFADTGAYNVCLIAWDSCSSDTFCETVHIVPVGIDETTVASTQFDLFPNPASDEVKIEFTITQEQTAKIVLEDVDGRLLEQLANENFAAGKHSLTLNLRSLSKGIYLVRKVEPNSVVTKKLIVQ